jgi:hypothetical protein
MWKSRDRMYDKKWMNEKKKERNKEKEKYEKEKKIWVCVKWTPRFSKVH